MSGVRKSASLSVVTLSWPIFIEIFLQMLIGNIDQFMMSHYSQEAVAAVANANQIMNIFIFLITVMSTATTILIAQYLGAKNPTKINEVTTVSIAFNFVFSSVAALFILVAHRMLFEWLGVPEEIIDDTSLYMTIVAASIPITGIYTAFVATFRGFSLPIITMCVAFVMNVVHIFSNMVLIYGWGADSVHGRFGRVYFDDIEQGLRITFGILSVQNPAQC